MGPPADDPGSVPPRLTPGRLLWRGLTRRCPVCGGGGLFHRWFRMTDRCPRCNFPMERIEGHWIGALGMNIIFSFGALLLTLGVGFALTQPDIAVAPLLAIGLTQSLVVPLLFFPFSKTLWSAVDLAMRPLEPGDDVDPRWISYR